MIFEFAGLKFNIIFYNTVENEKPYLLFLHGFTGSTGDWKSIVPLINPDFSSFGIDLIGHGESSSPDDVELYSGEAIANQIGSIIEHTIKKKVIPVGYSMGGRAALTFTAKYPDMVEALVLESATPGIENEKLREERVIRDKEIASYILSHTMEEFANYWMDMEIFNTQRRFSEEKRKKLRFTRKQNNPKGLANCLSGFGTGVMTPLYNQLKEIQCKTLLISGDLDTKFTNINNEIVELFPNAEHKIIKNAGHNSHMEEPQKFANVINEFLKLWT